MRLLDTPAARILLPLAVFVVTILAAEYIARIEDRATIEQERNDVVQQAATLRARLEGELNSTALLVSGVVAYVAAEPNIEPRKVERIFAALYRRDRHIRTMAIAEGTIIRHVFPLAGNERVLGVDYRQLGDQWELVERAIREKRTTLAGPLDLVQGGRGVIARTPVFLQGDRYWGMVSLVLDADSLFRAAGLQDHPTLALALRGVDGKGIEGKGFLGDGKIFAQHPVTMNIELPYGHWQLAALPAAGWSTGGDRSMFLRGLGLLIALALATANFAFLLERHRVRQHASHDTLTGLPNRKLLTDRIDREIARCQRQNKRFALLFIDLDGFKPINDRFGHKAGDHVLRTIADALTNGVRACDTVARVGGDEFVVMVTDIDNPQDARGVADNLQRLIRTPIRIPVRGPDAGASAEAHVDGSIGISLFPGDGTDIDTLISRADHAMYRAKGAGKGQVRLAGETVAV